MTRRAYFLLLGFALLGLGASAVSSYVHYQLLNNPQYSSFCDVSETVSCTQAYASAYGSLFGTPVAIFGATWFLGALALIVAGRPGRSRFSENMPGYLFALSTVGLAVILYLAYGSFVVLKAVCLLCVLTYVSVIGLFIVSGAQTRFPMTTLPQRLARDLQSAVASPVALVSLLVFVAAAGSAIAFFPKESTGAQVAAGGSQIPADAQAELQQWFDSQPRVQVPVGDTGDATVVIVKFNDYQCPPCRQTYMAYKPIIDKYRAEYPGKLLFITKDFPIDPECNSNTPGGSHLLACEAAVAMQLARAKKNYEKLEDWIFANQPTLTAPALKQAAKDLAGIDDYDAKYAQTLQSVKSDIATGALLQVSATPTFYINGVKVSGGLQPQYFDAIISYLLKKDERQASR